MVLISPFLADKKTDPQRKEVIFPEVIHFRANSRTQVSYHPALFAKFFFWGPRM